MSKFQIFLIVLYLFFFGGVGGWVLELLFRRFFSGANPERKWLNPGFLFGPCLPLYGFGTVLLFILSELDHTLFGSFSGTFWYYPVMFVVMALAMTLLEYIVGLVSFKGFHLRLWDYSKLWGNIQGIICPLFTFFWGVLSLGVLLPALSETPEAGRVVRGAPAGLIHGRRVLRHFPDRSVLLCPSGCGRAEKGRADRQERL